jgi:hypothetical protein
MKSRKTARRMLWPLERAQLIARHASAIQEERALADREISRARTETSRSRERALEELGRWHTQNGDLVEMVFRKIKHNLAANVGPAVAQRIQDAYRKIEPEEKIKAQLSKTMCSVMKVDVCAMNETVTVVRVFIPGFEFSYANDFAGLPGFPWRSLPRNFG